MRPSQRSTLLLCFILVVAFLVAGFAKGYAQNSSRARTLYGRPPAANTLLPDARTLLDRSQGRQLDALKNRQLNERTRRMDRLETLQRDAERDARQCGTGKNPACPPPPPRPPE